jgi:hypothetical protein
MDYAFFAFFFFFSEMPITSFHTCRFQEIPSSVGFSNAHSIARLMGIVANGGIATTEGLNHSESAPMKTRCEKCFLTWSSILVTTGMNVLFIFCSFTFSDL